jgi:hypothetical protein
VAVYSEHFSLTQVGKFGYRGSSFSDEWLKKEMSGISPNKLIVSIKLKLEAHPEKGMSVS